LSIMKSLSCANLISMGRHIPTPFHLSLAEGQQALDIESILRIVPGRRLVALARWQDRLVIVKLFFHARHWERKLRRDLSGINFLTQSKLPTPKVLLQTTTEDGSGGVLIIEYLQQGKSLNVLFDEATSEAELEAGMNLAIKTIALCHRAGLWQKDIHLDNFMLADGKVYVLDGGDIQREQGKLDSKTRMQNLALFVAQFPAVFDEKAPSLLQEYRQHVAVASEVEGTEFKTQIRQARKLRLAKFERKLFRSTTANKRARSSDKFCVYDRSIHSSELERFIQHPDSFIRQDKLLKQGNSSTVALVEIDGRVFVLKRYNIKSFWHGLSRMLRPSRAHHSWRNASVLEMLGVATPHPYLFLEERVFWIFRSRAYFLCEHIHEQDMGTQWGKESGSGAADESTGIDSIGEVVTLFRQFLRLMSDYRISHGDMKATNFIIHDKRLYVLDLDAMRRHQSRKVFAQKFSADLARFRKNWLDSPLGLPVDLMIQEIQLLQAD